MKDTHGRKIDYIRISITDLCNLRCRYCMPESGVNKRDHFDIITFEEVVDIVRAGVNLGVKKVRLTGGEPMVRKDIVTLVKMIRAVSADIDIAMTTNGLLLSECAKDLKTAGLDRVNISLDTLTREKYSDITRGGDLDTALKGIKSARENNLTPIKINTVLIDGFNDNEIEDFANLTIDVDIDVRFIELMPIGHSINNYSDAKRLSNETILKWLPQLVKIDDQDSKVCRSYQLPGAKGKIGLISPNSHMFCDRCNRIRITSDVKIKPCLHSNEEIDIRRLIKDGNNYEDILSGAVKNKPEKHKLSEQQFVTRSMNRIGG